MLEFIEKKMCEAGDDRILIGSLRVRTSLDERAVLCMLYRMFDSFSERLEILQEDQIEPFVREFLEEGITLFAGYTWEKGRVYVNFYAVGSTSVHISCVRQTAAFTWGRLESFAKAHFRAPVPQSVP